MPARTVSNGYRPRSLLSLDIAEIGLVPTTSCSTASRSPYTIVSQTEIGCLDEVDGRPNGSGQRRSGHALVAFGIGRHPFPMKNWTCGSDSPGLHCQRDLRTESSQRLPCRCIPTTLQVFTLPRTSCTPRQVQSAPSLFTPAAPLPTARPLGPHISRKTVHSSGRRHLSPHRDSQ